MDQVVDRIADHWGLPPRPSWGADRRTEIEHLAGGRCPECAPAGGCLRLLGAVRRRTADRPLSGQVVAVLLGGALPR